MILVFGGTTEGKQVAALLDDLKRPYFYSTKTKITFEGMGIPIHGEMTTIDINAFCKKHDISCIINASHPFAEVLHDTVSKVTINIPLIRFERQFPERTKHELVSYVATFKEALNVFESQNYKSLLGLSGVQTIHKLEKFWKHEQAWFRILDREVSRDIAKKANFPSEHLIFGLPQSASEEIKLFESLKPDVIFTKESGINGKLDQKIEAAITVNTPIVILAKPLVSKKYLCVYTITALQNFLSTIAIE